MILLLLCLGCLNNNATVRPEVPSSNREEQASSLAINSTNSVFKKKDSKSSLNLADKNFNNQAFQSKQGMNEINGSDSNYQNMDFGPNYKYFCSEAEDHNFNQAFQSKQGMNGDNRFDSNYQNTGFGFNFRNFGFENSNQLSGTMGHNPAYYESNTLRKASVKDNDQGEIYETKTIISLLESKRSNPRATVIRGSSINAVEKARQLVEEATYLTTAEVKELLEYIDNQSHVLEKSETAQVIQQNDPSAPQAPPLPADLCFEKPTEQSKTNKKNTNKKHFDKGIDPQAELLVELTKRLAAKKLAAEEAEKLKK